ncbi:MULTISPECIES: hypothetical protein [Lactobacillus]|uniref:Uncharacterized protein n=2 Tax=Lactobacillus TaxID=1578 RepID=A0AB33CIU5_LACGS|nr:MULTISPECIES: hypothetical protein [Lactobacillus]ART99126.1 hypothetical protein CCE30_09630 [Lactobacillus gasseri]MBV6739520.1 hypothetical protein [Lactobacillus gasseri CECT 5714]MDK6868440.1 hypothetical protein [Lactobacillus paragasseri]QTP20652.1 hypothetical protein J7S35_001133 [Lactobacillus gasseri]TVU99997.1 hypothetical protein FOF71_05265 [Lactobacillus paragasseri]
MKKEQAKIGVGCEIRQTPKGVYIDGVKQKGAIDVQVKKNSRKWTEVLITYLAHSFLKERACDGELLTIQELRKQRYLK